MDICKFEVSLVYIVPGQMVLPREPCLRNKREKEINTPRFLWDHSETARSVSPAIEKQINLISGMPNNAGISIRLALLGTAFYPL